MFKNVFILKHFVPLLQNDRITLSSKHRIFKPFLCGCNVSEAELYSWIPHLLIILHFRWPGVPRWPGDRWQVAYPRKSIQNVAQLRWQYLCICICIFNTIIFKKCWNQDAFVLNAIRRYCVQDGSVQQYCSVVGRRGDHKYQTIKLFYIF